jgi:hypothetical protein
MLFDLAGDRDLRMRDPSTNYEEEWRGLLAFHSLFDDLSNLCNGAFQVDGGHVLALRDRLEVWPFQS